MAHQFPMEVRFPGLGIEFDVNNVAVSIFGFKIYWYAIIILTGFLLAVWYAFANSKRFGLKKDPMLDVILIGLVSALVCGRLYYVLFRLEHYNSFAEIVNIRDGGMAIYGAVIGAFASAIISCKWRKVDLMTMADLGGIGFLIGQGIGRWGNFANQEAFGGPTSMPWGMESANTLAVVPGSPVHPCFLYESLWCAAGFVMLHIMSRKCYKFRGQLFLFYVLWYGMGRVWIEGLRTDSLWLVDGVIRVSQLIAGLSLLVIPLIVLGFKGKIFKPVAAEPGEPEALTEEEN